MDHQWVVIATYGLTSAEAAATDAGHEQRLDAEHRLSVDGPACLNCELVYSPDLAARSCAGERYVIERNPNARVRQA